VTLISAFAHNADAAPYAIQPPAAAAQRCLVTPGPLEFEAATILASAPSQSIASREVDGSGNAHDLVLDLDNNGKQDLIALDTTTQNVIRIALNPTLTIITFQALPVPAGTFQVVAADLDNDGFPDLVSATSTNVSVSWNNGNGTFTSASTLSTTTGAIRSITVGDYNIDGEGDIFVTNGTLGIAARRNLGNRQFSATWYYFNIGLTFINPIGPIATLFIDADTKPDVAITNLVDGFLVDRGIVTFRSTSTPTALSFSSTAATQYQTYQVHGLAAGDFNNDGLDDLAALPQGQSSVSLLINTGSGFPNSVSIPTGSSSTERTITKGDIDGDGDLDLVVANRTSNTISVLVNNLVGTTAQYSLALTLPLTASPTSVALIDLDRDSDLDILTTNNAGGLSVVRNKRFCP